VLAQPETPTQKIPDRYIVVFEDGMQRPAALANEHARAYGLQVRFVYTSAIEGYAAVFPNDRALQRVQSDPRVDYVEQDQVVRATAQTLPWGIDRIEADISPTAAISGGGGDLTNVNAYIIDTGIDATHPDLNMVGHVNFAGGKNTDCNGHGTHVAGTVGAKDDDSYVVGAAPGAPLTGVKVLGCSGSGSTSGVIKGVDWVTANAVKPAIANMSLGGGRSDTLDKAVRASAASGVFYSIAAGNDGDVACNYSPARAGLATADTNGDGLINDKDTNPDTNGDGLINHEDSNGIVTTAATNKTENDPYWSNYGRCVDIWAPGVSILSTKKGGGTTTMSGTSMAASHIGGGGALYLSNPRTVADPTDPNTVKVLDKPVDVEKSLKAAAKTFGTISNAGGTREITREDVGGF
jgi:subtilisin family serine protease